MRVGYFTILHTPCAHWVRLGWSSQCDHSCLLNRYVWLEYNFPTLLFYKNKIILLLLNFLIYSEKTLKNCTSVSETVRWVIHCQELSSSLGCHDGNNQTSIGTIFWQKLIQNGYYSGTRNSGRRWTRNSFEGNSWNRFCYSQTAAIGIVFAGWSRESVHLQEMGLGGLGSP